ncbi:MAG TPA: carbamate kinase [Bacteroidales bacterium]|nr:carbamate kinase [Bacteroidales bacterium]HRZ49115.1 carbamate kinase [Bacteroidales bacterium]
MNKLAVVAFGGNALLRGDQKGTIDEQEQNVFDTCSRVYELIKRGYDLVIGHGNGPQVGNVLLQHEAGYNVFGIPKMPIDVCVAETQGSIGYFIEQQMKNVLLKDGIEKDILTIITEVFIDRNDPAFSNPTKPVGPFYSEEQAMEMKSQNGWSFQKDPRNRGWRRVVPSPAPTHINNVKSIEQLARSGAVVITVGGGGIPVFWVEENKLQGIDAVIDKDLASALLAKEIRADEFYILTDVPNVCLHFNTPQEKRLKVITVDEAKQYLAEGHFTEGSMAPKVRAAIYFVEHGGKETIITEASHLSNPDAGTRIVRN